MWPIAWVMTFVQTTTCSGTGTFKGIEAGSGTGFCEIVGLGPCHGSNFYRPRLVLPGLLSRLPLP